MLGTFHNSELGMRKQAFLAIKAGKPMAERFI